MSDGGNDSFIVPPPSIRVPPPAPPVVEPAAASEPEEFIALPPGIVDSATLKLAERSRPVPTPVEGDDGIVFFPAAPGIPVAAPAAPAAPDALPAVAVAAQAEQAVDAEETRIGTARHAAPAWRLVLPGDGQVVPVTDAVFIGRNPANTPERPDAALLPVVDPSKSLSKTHAMLEVEDGRLWVHDLDSTNGVVVVLGDSVVEVDPGSRALVPAGADLELGDYVIQVEHG